MFWRKKDKAATPAVEEVFVQEPEVIAEEVVEISAEPTIVEEVIEESAVVDFVEPAAVEDVVVPEPTDIFKCSKSECTRESTRVPGSIGTERSEPINFELFGTYTFAPFPAPKRNTGLTTLEEGGRNTRRA
jgi:hypothetical protein